MSEILEILIVEDEKNLGLTLLEYLIDKDFKCSLATSCAEAKNKFTNKVSIVLMDVGLPDGNGIDLAKDLRSIRKDFLLLFLSAQNDPQTKLAGLELGAEDYITKPFDLRELTLRLEKALKSHSLIMARNKSIQLGQLEILFDRYEVKDANGKITSLSQKECAILELLYTHKNEVISRDHIIETIWGSDAYPTNRTVDNYIVKLRKWIETDISKPIEIKSVRGVGYQLSIKESHE